MALVWGLLLMPIGVLVRTVGMWRTGVLPPLQASLLLAGVALVGFPDGAEIVNLVAAIAMAAAMVPYGIGLLRSGQA